MPGAIRAAALAASAALTLSLSGCGEASHVDGSARPTALPMDVTTALPSGVSPFESFVGENEDHCRPWLTRSTCPDNSYRGLVIFFHGYSACAQQVNALGPVLNQRCLDVFAPNHPGHGIKSITNCDKPGANCTIRWNHPGQTSKGRMGFNLDGVPTKGTQYMDHIKRVNDMVEIEMAFRANATGKAVGDLYRGVAGLSLGGALATYAVLDRPGLYTHQLLINPFYGQTSKTIDEAARLNPVERHMEMMVEKEVLDGLTMASDYLEGSPTSHVFDELVSEGVQWGENCPKIFAGHRNGFCVFEYKHAGAMMSLGQHTIARALSTPATAFPLTQVISTERDGLSRNGYTYALARHIYQGHSNAAMCMYRWSNETDRSTIAFDENTNCIPHASLDPLDNPHIDRWWEDALFSRIKSFLSHYETNIESETWRGTRDECVEMPLRGTAMLTHQWMRQAADPEVAPRSDFELHGIPGLIEDGSQLAPDTWAKTACHIPLLGRLVSRATFVNCSIFDRPGRRHTRPSHSAPPGSSNTTKLIWDAATAMSAWMGAKPEDSADGRSAAALAASAEERLTGGRLAVEEWLSNTPGGRRVAPAAAVLGLAPLLAGGLGHVAAEPADERVQFAEKRAAAAEKRAAAAEKRAAAAERREKRAEAAEKRAEALEKRAEAAEKRAEERLRLAEGGAPVEDSASEEELVSPAELEAQAAALDAQALETTEGRTSEEQSFWADLEEQDSEEQASALEEPALQNTEDRTSEEFDNHAGGDSHPSLGALVGRLASKGKSAGLKDLAEKLMRRRDGAEEEAEDYSPKIVVKSILRMMERMADKFAHGHKSGDVTEESSADDPSTAGEHVLRDARAVEDLMSARKTPLADLRTLHKDLDGKTLGKLAGTLVARNANHKVIENVIDQFEHPTDDVIMA